MSQLLYYTNVKFVRDKKIGVIILFITHIFEYLSFRELQKRKQECNNLGYNILGIK